MPTVTTSGEFTLEHAKRLQLIMYQVWKRVLRERAGAELRRQKNVNN